MAVWKLAREDQRISAAGEFRIEDARAIWRALLAASRAPGARTGARPEARPGARLDLDLSGVVAVDGTVMALLLEVRRRLIARGTPCEIVGAGPAVLPIVQLYRRHETKGPAVARRTVRGGVVRQLGVAVDKLVGSVLAVGSLLGELLEGVGRTLRRPGPITWRTLPVLVERAGPDGIFIVVVLNLLVGVVIVFQSMHQLELYGATIYAADLVGISGTRELAPLMTAVIMSGRSGAAFAAEIGTMRVSEEIDAMRTLGIAPVPHLVLPRIAALAIAAPVLTLLGDVAMILGGLVVAVGSLDLTPRAYVTELRAALVPSDVWTGLLKSVVFGSTIAIIGCYQGLTTRGAASGVGRSTTATVVYCLFAIVLLDTLLTVIFRTVGV